MEMEQQHRQPQEFDVLAVDAFNSDAIPIHLLTRECFQTYLYHLKNDGILAVHISNRYFDLQPVVRGLASLDPNHGLQALLITAEKDESRGIAATTWILLTANQSFLAHPEIRKCITPWSDAEPGTLLWTDDYSNLFSLLRR
jgi:spermidine synthase